MVLWAVLIPTRRRTMLELEVNPVLKTAAGSDPQLCPARSAQSLRGSSVVWSRCVATLLCRLFPFVTRKPRSKTLELGAIFPLTEWFRGSRNFAGAGWVSTYRLVFEFPPIAV